MDAILQQLSQTIQNNNVTDRKEAECLALREIILSGLSRSGFMKLFTYLPPFDSLKDNKLYLCFLDQDMQKKAEAQRKREAKARLDLDKEKFELDKQRKTQDDSSEGGQIWEIVVPEGTAAVDE